jgi:hypothetical protein
MGRLLRVVVPGLASCLLIAGCSSDEEARKSATLTTTAPITSTGAVTEATPTDEQPPAASWTRDELRAMMPAKKVFRVLGPHRWDTGGYISNARAAQFNENPDVSASDMASQGRVAGFEVSFDAGCGGYCYPGLGIMEARVDVFESPEKASAYIGDWISRLREAQRQTAGDPSARLHSVTEIEPGRVGNEPIGVRYTQAIGNQSLFYTVIAFRVGPVLGSSTVGRLDDPGDESRRTYRLAKLLEQRIRHVLKNRD